MLKRANGPAREHDRKSGSRCNDNCHRWGRDYAVLCRSRWPNLEGAFCSAAAAHNLKRTQTQKSRARARARARTRTRTRKSLGITPSFHARLNARPARVAEAAGKQHCPPALYMPPPPPTCNHYFERARSCCSYHLESARRDEGATGGGAQRWAAGLLC